MIYLKNSTINLIFIPRNEVDLDASVPQGSCEECQEELAEKTLEVNTLTAEVERMENLQEINIVKMDASNTITLEPDADHYAISKANIILADSMLGIFATQNGLYKASDYNVRGLAEVNVDVKPTYEETEFINANGTYTYDRQDGYKKITAIVNVASQPLTPTTEEILTNGSFTVDVTENSTITINVNTAGSTFDDWFEEENVEMYGNVVTKLVPKGEIETVGAISQMSEIIGISTPLYNDTMIENVIQKWNGFQRQFCDVYGIDDSNWKSSGTADFVNGCVDNTKTWMSMSTGKFVHPSLFYKNNKYIGYNTAKERYYLNVGGNYNKFNYDLRVFQRPNSFQKMHVINMNTIGSTSLPTGITNKLEVFYNLSQYNLSGTLSLNLMPNLDTWCYVAMITSLRQNDGSYGVVLPLTLQQYNGYEQIAQIAIDKGYTVTYE